MKKLSEKVEYKKFKMESIGTIAQLVKAGVFMSKLDIKDAYSIPIYESEQKYLEFQFDRFYINILHYGMATQKVQQN